MSIKYRFFTSQITLIDHFHKEDVIDLFHCVVMRGHAFYLKHGLQSAESTTAFSFAVVNAVEADLDDSKILP